MCTQSDKKHFQTNSLTMSKVFMAQKVGITPEEAFEVLGSSDNFGNQYALWGVQCRRLQLQCAWSNKPGLLSFTSTGYLVMGRH
jgi:hypothetical protein